jgi:tetratricopeptide (TPR) repeat protein
MKRGFVLLLLVVSTSWLDPYHDEVSRGNEKFYQKRYNDSKRHYRDASKYAPSENEKRKLKFNEGDASYMTSDYEEAVTHFSKSLRSEDRDVQKRAFFNMGNTYLRMKRYKDAIDSYISALRIDPSYEKAKKNLEYLMRERNRDRSEKSGNGDDQGKSRNEKEGGNKNREKGDTINKVDGGDGERHKKSGMSREQIRNILESMKKKPVGRKKGGDDGIRMLEKNW